MKKIYSKKVFQVLCEKTRDMRELSGHNWKSFEDYSERETLWLVTASVMPSDIEFLKNAMIFKYRIRSRVSAFMADFIIRNDFSTRFAGTYPLFIVNSDNSVICPHCFWSEIDKAYGDYSNVKFKAEAIDNNYEDKNLYCDFCNERIESAYCEE